jgi:hypothetical protein
MSTLPPRLTPDQVLEYELNASWWAPLVWWGWGQSLAASYFAWKVRRKWNRYALSLEESARVRASAERHALYSQPLREARP